jgi:hypothetical protein
MRDGVFVGEGVRRRPEDWVLLWERDGWVVEVRKTNLESFCSRNSAIVRGVVFSVEGWIVPKTMLGPSTMVVKIG